VVANRQPLTIDQAIDLLTGCRGQLGGDAPIRFVDGEPVVVIAPASDEVIVTDRTGEEDF
jgi:hypothetical protein